MTIYSKTVKHDSTAVSVKVYRDSVQFDSERFITISMFESRKAALVEKKFKQAHKWADDLIKVCKEQEC